eukprot:CAMPEP_0185732618 /NCGR_PEP_ID=MMETSP1171-20130828/16895_1 /TAXON_ID=374046 /ORGANISM="Helicotheca tamensis, Strain CCMP826" /LENGTH=343 /DNA_ID=CAMNT_0028402153 /DNA_START=1 /DNA_END=1032 /DNA_ORIENTATION=-
MATLSVGVILVCITSFTIAFVIIIVTTIGNPSTLARYCIPRASLPPDSQQRSRISRWLRVHKWNCFGYVFDFRSYRESLRLRRENEQRILIDEQIRRLEELAETEMELRAQIENGDSSSDVRAQYATVQRFRYALAMRTREERRRRRRLLWQQAIEAEELAGSDGEDVEDAHYKNTLSLDDKRKVLERVLEFCRYRLVDSDDDEKGDNWSKDSNRSPSTKEDILVQESNLENRESDGRTSPASVNNETGGAAAESDESGKNKIVSNRMCSICLDAYEEGELLAMRPDSCLHVFHKECLEQWLIARRSDCCPICRSTILTEDDWRTIHSQVLETRDNEAEEGSS